MSVNPELVGRAFPPTAPYLVGREKVREFARAVFATDPQHTDPAAARAEYLAACVTVGQEVTVSLPADEVLRGTAVDVDAEGRIVVQDAAGKRHVLSAGDVTHLRPA